MLDSLFSSFGGALPRAWMGIGLFPGRDRDVSMMARHPGVTPDALTFAVTPRILRLAAAAAVAANGLVPLMEWWRVAIAADRASVQYASIATAATIALHLRHVAFGLRNERPPARAWTLATLALVHVAATILVGRAWSLQFPALAGSVLIVVRGPAAPLLVGAIALSPLILAQTALRSWQLTADTMTGLPETYLALAVAWRTVTLYVPVRLVAMIQQLAATRRSLESRAIIQTRSRIEGDLRSGLELTLQRIISHGDAARRAIGRDPARAAADLRALVTDSRHALAEARRIAACSGTPSLRAESDAATALVQAAGSTYRLIVAQNVPLDSAGPRSDGAIRAAVVRALERGEQKAGFVIVELDGAGELRVEVTS